MNKSRRNFISQAGWMGTGALIGTTMIPSWLKAQSGSLPAGEMFFKISLAQWSLHKAFFAKKLDNLDFAATAKNEFGIEALEYVNQFFKDKAEDKAYLDEMNQRASDLGVSNVLVMIDGEGQLGSTNDDKRKEAVENHYKWVEAAKYLGCHSIRVNAAGKGTAEEVAAAATDGLGRLSEFAADYEIGVIVENHGGYSSDGEWLSGVLAAVDNPNCGSLPDFGNFCIKRKGWENCLESYDRYLGTEQLMPFAKGVSAKSHDFNEAGEEIHTDFRKMLQIVKDAGYTGYIGVEYEGRELDEYTGIKKTKELLEKIGKELA